MPPRVLILIPAFNEGPRIGGLVKRLRELYRDHDVLVVDDGSWDDTASAARAAGAEVVSHPFNLGYGVAIQTGYKFAFRRDYEFLVQLDGDGQHDPTFVPQLLEPVIAGASDFALGSRFLSSHGYQTSVVRRLGMLFFRKLVSWLIGQAISDSTSGFQAFNRHVIRFFTTEVFPCDYPDADMLLTLHRAGFRIREVPVTMYASATGKSMHRGWKPLYYIFKMLLSIFVTLLRKDQVEGKAGKAE